MFTRCKKAGTFYLFHGEQGWSLRFRTTFDAELNGERDIRGRGSSADHASPLRD